MNEVAAQKITMLQRWVARAREAFATAGAEFQTDRVYQDAVLFNATRACDIAIKIANMVIRKKRLGIPMESKDSFGILMREKIVDQDLGTRLQGLVEFRDNAILQYREMNLSTVEAVIGKNLDALLTFAEVVRPQLEDEATACTI